MKTLQKNLAAVALVGLRISRGKRRLEPTKVAIGYPPATDFSCSVRSKREGHIR